LSDSLGGNSKTTILVCCSPHIWNRFETISALRFAQRAKCITNRATINKKKTREQLEKRIRQLEEIVSDLRKKVRSKTIHTDNQNSVEIKEIVSEEQTKKIEQLMEQQEAMQSLLNKKNEQIQQFEDDMKAKDAVIKEFSNYREENKRLQSKLLEKKMKKWND